MSIGLSTRLDTQPRFGLLPDYEDPLMRGVVGMWQFNEGGGSRVFDSSRYHNLGTWNGTGTHWASGKFGWCGQLNGSDDKITIPGVSPPNCVAIWVNHPKPGAAQYVIDFRDASGTGYIYTQGFGALNNASLTVSSGTRYYISSAGESSTFYPCDEWVLIVVSNITTVINGSIYVGSRYSSASFLSGNMGPIKLFSRIPSATEIHRLYVEGARAGFHTRTLFPAAAAGGDTTIQIPWISITI